MKIVDEKPTVRTATADQNRLADMLGHLHEMRVALGEMMALGDVAGEFTNAAQKGLAVAVENVEHAIGYQAMHVRELRAAERAAKPRARAVARTGPRLVVEAKAA